MIYILLIALHVNSGAQLHSVEFNDKQSCLIAAEEMRKQVGRSIEAIACVPKGKP